MLWRFRCAVRGSKYLIHLTITGEVPIEVPRYCISHVDFLMFTWKMRACLSGLRGCDSNAALFTLQ